jgi:hypothetical protein
MFPTGMLLEQRCCGGLVDSSEQHGASAMGEQLGDHGIALRRTLPASVHGFGHALAKGAVVVDEGVAHFSERQPA